MVNLTKQHLYYYLISVLNQHTDPHTVLL